MPGVIHVSNMGHAERFYQEFSERAVGRFDANKNSVKFKKGKHVCYLCFTYFVIRGIANFSNGSGYSAFLDWMSISGQLCSAIVPLNQIVGDFRGVAKDLADQGLYIAPSLSHVFEEYIHESCNAADTLKLNVFDRICFFPVSQSEPEGAYGFILPQMAIIPEDVGHNYGAYFKPSCPSAIYEAYRESGELDSWKEEVAPVANNVLWVLDLCAGFASVLLDVAEEENFGFHTWGASSSGKSTGGQLMISIWGCAANSQQTSGPSLFQSWGATLNGIEALASIHSGGPLLLDELGVLHPSSDPNTYGMLEGRSKARMQEAGRLRAQNFWRILLVSTGEVSMQNRIESNGKRQIMAGELSRCMDICIDKLPPDESMSTAESESLARRLRVVLSNNFGVAGPAFIAALIREYPTLAELKSELKTAKSQKLDLLIETLGRDHLLQSVHRRALQHFAITWMAGDLACRFGILPFDSSKVDAAILAVAKTWLDGFPSLSEFDRLIGSIQRHLINNSRNIFKLTGEAVKSGNVKKPEIVFHDGKFWFSENQFFSARGGMTVLDAAKLLYQKQVLHRHKGDAQYKIKIGAKPEIFGSSRYYCLYADKIFCASDISKLFSGDSKPPEIEIDESLTLADL